tara:strand:- start:51 stop:1022 length:972 start_codon:yes stop_codon:yes gene_type:complete
MAFKMNKPSITQGTTGHKSALKHAAHYPGNKADHTLASHGKKLVGDVGAIAAGVGQVAKTLSKSRQGDRTNSVYSFGDNYKKGKSMYETGETSKEYDDIEKQKRIDSATKKTGSALKKKSYEKDASQSRKDSRADEKIGGQRYNQNKAERLQGRAKNADRKHQKASAAESEAIQKYGPSFITGEGLSKEQQKANRKISKKYAKTSKKAAVKEALANRELRQKGEKGAKPEKVMREGKGLKVEMPSITRGSSGGKKSRKYGTKVAGNRGKRKLKLDVDPGSVSVVDKTRVDVGSTIAARKEYRQDKGLRGNINTRRDAKGKKKI